MARALAALVALALLTAGCGQSASSSLPRSQFGGTAPRTTAPAAPEVRLAPAPRGERGEAPRRPGQLRSQFGGTAPGAEP